MSLQLGANFPSRWLAAPQDIRRQFLRDLNNVCVLLDPKTDFDEWHSDQVADPDHTIPVQVAPVTNENTLQKTLPSENAPKVALTKDALIALEQRLLKQADQVIERALDPIRAELRNWIQEQIRQEIDVLKNSSFL
jgi:hypothetical protein